MVTGAAGHHGPRAARHVLMGLKTELANVTIHRRQILENPVLVMLNSKKRVLLGDVDSVRVIRLYLQTTTFFMSFLI